MTIHKQLNSIRDKKELQQRVDGRTEIFWLYNKNETPRPCMLQAYRANYFVILNFRILTNINFIPIPPREIMAVQHIFIHAAVRRRGRLFEVN
jgi:hypothetical protein